MLRLIATLCLMLTFLTAGSSQDRFPYGRYWELVIQGRVTDSTGAPIRGVQILASPDMPARLGKMTYYAVTNQFWDRHRITKVQAIRCWSASLNPKNNITKNRYNRRFGESIFHKFRDFPIDE